MLTSAESGANASFWEHLNDFSAIQYAIPLNMVHMNRDAFESLDESQQDAIKQAARETDEHNWEVVKQRVAQNYETLESHDVAIHDPIPDEFRAGLEEAATPVVDNWLDNIGERGERILDEFDNSQASP